VKGATAAVSRKHSDPMPVVAHFDRETALMAILAGLSDDQADRIIRKFGSDGKVFEATNYFRLFN
jgi:hypothetical protein